MTLYITLVLLGLPLSSVGDIFEIPLTKLKDKIDKTGVLTDFRSRYAGTIAIGTPHQKIQAIFTTGSASIWIPVRNCVSRRVLSRRCDQGRNVFSPAASRTFVNTTRTFESGYADSIVRGYVFKDRLSIMGKDEELLTFSNNVFMGAATHVVRSEDPIFGLPSRRYSHPYEYSYNTVLHQRVSNRDIRSTLFSLYTADCVDGVMGCGDNAMLTIGGLNIENCEYQVNYTRLVPSTPLWEFRVDGLIVRGRFSSGQAYTAYLDSGSGYIGIPGYLLSIYLFRWEAISLGYEDAYAVPCRIRLNLIIKINNIRYPIPSANLLHPLPEAGQRRFGSGMCQLAIRTSDRMNSIQLGEPFLRSYCVVHDIARRRIGLSHKIREDLHDREEDFDQVEEEEDRAALSSSNMQIVPKATS